MNKKVLIIVGIVALAMIGVGVYLLLKKSSSESKAGTLIEQGSKKSGIENVEATLKGLLTSKKPLKCTFSSNSTEYSVSGTVYTGKGRVRQDFQSKTGEIEMTGHLIVDNLNTYMWNDDSSQGYKFALDEMPTTQPLDNSSGNQNQTPDINEPMNFSCQNWNVDDSLFTLPSNVSFQSFSVPVVNQNGTDEGTSESMCAVCDNVPAGETRNTCRAQLNCQ